MSYENKSDPNKVILLDDYFTVKGVGKMVLVVDRRWVTVTVAMAMQAGWSLNNKTVDKEPRAKQKSNNVQYKDVNLHVAYVQPVNVHGVSRQFNQLLGGEFSIYSAYLQPQPETCQTTQHPRSILCNRR